MQPTEQNTSTFTSHCTDNKAKAYRVICCMTIQMKRIKRVSPHHFAAGWVSVVKQQFFLKKTLIETYFDEFYRDAVSCLVYVGI